MSFEKEIAEFSEIGYNLIIESDIVARLHKISPKSRMGYTKIWAYRFKDTARMMEYIQEEFTRIKGILDYKSKYKEEQKVLKAKLKEQVRVGDAFKCSWGFEQTQVDLYLVVGKPSPSKVLLQQVGYTSVESTSWCSENVVINEEHLIGEPFLKTLNGDSIKFSSFQFAFKMENKYQKCYRSWGY